MDFRKIITLSVILAKVFGAANCSSEPTKSSEKESTDAETFNKKELSQRLYCPSEEPSDLINRILAWEGKTPESIQNVLARSSTSDHYHFLRETGDEAGARAVLTKIFRNSGTPCKGYEPTSEDLLYRANHFLKSDFPSDWPQALDLFVRAGNREGQLAVARKYENAAANGDMFSAQNDFVDAIRVYEQLGEFTASRRIALRIFKEQYSVDKALQIVKSIGVTPDSELFIARGDYLMSEAGKEHQWDARNSYIKSGNHDKVRSFMFEAERRGSAEDGKTGMGSWWYSQAQQAAEFLKDKDNALRYATLDFVASVNDSIYLKDWKRAGLNPTPDLYQQRGDYHLGNGIFWAAFEAYKAAGNEEGMNRAVAGMLTPLSPQESE